jgi:hypothetical protein
MAFTFLMNILGYCPYIFLNSVVSSKYTSVNEDVVCTWCTFYCGTEHSSFNSMSQYMQAFPAIKLPYLGI